MVKSLNGFDSVADAISSHSSQLAQIASLVPAPNGTDDTANIQAILNTPYRSKIVKIPDGTYLINVTSTSGNADKPNGGLSIPSNTILELSPNTILQAITNNAGSYSIIRIQDVSNAMVRGGSLIGDRTTHTGTTGQQGYGICVNGSTNITIENINISNCWGDGILLNAGVATDTNACKNIKIRGVVCDNNRRNGLTIQFADGVFISGCRFSNTNGTAPQSGIDIEPGNWTAYYLAKNIKISGCEFIGNTTDGIQINPNNVSQFSIENNTFIGNGNRGISVYSTTNGVLANNIFQGNSSGAGIELQSSSDISVIGNKSIGNKNGINVLTGAIKNTITGNTCSGNTQNGIASIAGSDNTISNNVCESNTQEGIYLYSSSNTIVGNNISESNSIGIHLTSTSNNNKITGNYCRKNNGEGIKIDGSHHNSIQNNTCLENSQTTNTGYDNILLFQCNYSNIQGNTCRKGATTNLPRCGIFVQDAASTGNLFMQNDCYTGGATSGVANSGTSTLFGAGNRNNDGTFSTTPN